MKRILYGLIAVFVLLGIWSAGSQAVTFYRDYQEFKAMRVWVRLRVAAEQRARDAAKARPAPAPAPAQTPLPAAQERPK